MANDSDSKFFAEMMSMPETLMAQYFASNSHKIIDDANYWNVLGTLWKLGGTVKQQDLWLKMFLSKRKRKHKIMKSRERKKWRKLPKAFNAYRAINCDEEIETAISWSLSRNTVEKYFSYNGERKVVGRQFSKDDVFAFFDRRGEDEVLVNIKLRG